jgi:hypothetical protein
MMARQPPKNGSARTPSSEAGVPVVESPFTHAWCFSCHEVCEVRWTRIGDEEAPTDVACKTCHLVIAVLYKGKPTYPPTPPASP